MLRNTDSDWSMHDSVEKLQVHFHSPQIILPAQMTKKPMCEGHIRIIISHRLHDLLLPQCSYSIHRRILAVIGCYFGRLIGPGSPGPPVAIVRAVLPTQVLFYGGRKCAESTIVPWTIVDSHESDFCHFTELPKMRHWRIRSYRTVPTNRGLFLRVPNITMSS